MENMRYGKAMTSMTLYCSQPYHGMVFNRKITFEKNNAKPLSIYVSVSIIGACC